jgi:hypothetical protein
MILMGWDIEQWAVCLAAFPPSGDQPKDWLVSKKLWLTSRGYLPGAERLMVARSRFDVEDNKPPKDWDRANKLFNDPAWWRA